MSYVIQATLSNAQHPDNGNNEILFPLSREDYPSEIQRLAELGVGDAVRQDCKVEEIDSSYQGSYQHDLLLPENHCHQ